MRTASFSEDFARQVARTTVVQRDRAPYVLGARSARDRGRFPDVQLVRVDSTTQTAGRYPGHVLSFDAVAGTYADKGQIWIVDENAASLSAQRYLARRVGVANGRQVFVVMQDATSGGTTHALLSATHTDVNAQSPAKGKVIVASASVWDTVTLGTDEDIFTADSAQTLGINWKAPGFGRQTFSNADYTVTGRKDAYVAQTGTLTLARTVTLPAASARAGQTIIVYDESNTVSATNKITIQRAGTDTINGGTSIDLVEGRRAYVFVSDGSSKWTIVRHPTFRGAGSTHAPGLVPDPPASASTPAQKYLCEDVNWRQPPNTPDLSWYFQSNNSSYFPGRYHCGALTNLPTTYGTVTLANNTFYCNPMLSPGNFTSDQMAIHVSTAGAAGAKVRIGIYYQQSRTDLAPSLLLGDVGEIDVTTTGFKTITSALTLTGPNPFPTHNIYWLVILCNDATVVLQGVRSDAWYPFMGFPNDFSAAPSSCIQAAQTYGAFPNTFPTGGTLNAGSTVQPLIGIRGSD